MRSFRAILVELSKNIDCNIWRLMALANLAHRGFNVQPPDLPRTASVMLYRRRFELKFGTLPKRWFAKAWFPMTTLRVRNGERVGDTGAPVVLDFDKGIIKLRAICCAELLMPKWAYERVEEGGDIKYAMLGIKDGKSCLALVAEREVEPIVPAMKMVIDVNSWKYGIVWALIRPTTRAVRPARERPDLGFIGRLYGEIIELERKYGKLRRLGLHKTIYGKRIRQKIKAKRKRLYAYLRDYAQKLAGRLARIALRNRAFIIIDVFLEESRRELLEEKLPSDLIKLYVASVKRFVKLLLNQLKWYGVPYELRRLSSTKCPECGNGLTHVGNRKMKCPNCGVEEDRDMIPIKHALKIPSPP